MNKEDSKQINKPAFELEIERETRRKKPFSLEELQI